MSALPCRLCRHELPFVESRLSAGERRLGFSRKSGGTVHAPSRHSARRHHARCSPRPRSPARPRISRSCRTIIGRRRSRTLRCSPPRSASRTTTARSAPLSLAEFDRQAAQAAAFLKRLDAIPAASLPASEQANRAILKRQLEDAIEANRFGQRQLLYSTLGSYPRLPRRHGREHAVPDRRRL